MPLTLLPAPPRIQKAIYTSDLSIIFSRCQICQSENIPNFAGFFIFSQKTIQSISRVHKKKLSITWLRLLLFSLHLEVFESDCAKIPL